MARIADIPFEQLTDAQRRVYREIAAPRRGNVKGPFAVWIRTPDLADKANQLGNALRLHGKLEKRLFELMVLLVARHWSAQYEWSVHERAALEAGLSREIVEEIRIGRAPRFAREDERVVFDAVSEINNTRSLSEPTYRRATAAIGVDLLVELVTGIGFYSMIAMVVNAFDAPVPDGSRPLP